MDKTHRDQPIEEIRELRRQISARFEHDPARLVEHYIKLQEQYRDRLSDTTKPADGNSQSVA